MVVDVRYHLASLVGVFFALGLGILIGTSISSDGKLLKEQATVIDAIEGQLGSLRSEEQKLRSDLGKAVDEVANYRRFAQEVMPRLVSGLLEENSVSVVGLGHDPLTTQVENVLKQAGAKIEGAARVSDPSQLLGTGILASQAPLDPGFVQGLIAGLTGEQTVSDKTDRLVRWVKPATTRADWLVVVSENGLDEPARRLVTALHQKGMRVIAAVSGNQARAQRTLGVKTVTDTETPLGLLALVEALAQNAESSRTVTGGN